MSLFDKARRVIKELREEREKEMEWVVKSLKQELEHCDCRDQVTVVEVDLKNKTVKLVDTPHITDDNVVVVVIPSVNGNFYAVYYNVYNELESATGSYDEVIRAVGGTAYGFGLLEEGLVKSVVAEMVLKLLHEYGF